MTIRDVYNYMNEIAPFAAAEEWDNSGLLLGTFDMVCNKVMLALDITQDVVRQAVELDVDLIITHHPVIFSPLKNIDYDSAVAKLVSSRIAVISSHTCFDAANGGMNDILCEKLELKNIRPVPCSDGFEFRAGELEKATSVEVLARHTAKKLGSDCVSCSLHDKIVTRVAICSGAGSSVCREVISSGAEVFITGELKYNNIIELYESGVAVVLAGHFETEQIFKETLQKKLSKHFNGLDVVVAEEKGYLMGV